jgi:hypothetical protein
MEKQKASEMSGTGSRRARAGENTCPRCGCELPFDRHGFWSRPEGNLS